MPIDPKQTYTQTPSKLRRLWEYAMRLIAEHEDFDSRLTDAEKKLSELSRKLTSTIGG